MLSRIAGILTLTGGLMLGVLATVPAQAVPSTAVPRAPELDPSGLTSGAAILIGGLLLVSERRRKPN